MNTQKTRKSLTCGLCHVVFDDEDYNPRVLPCLHIFCLRCLQKLHQTDRVVCPSCFKIHIFKGTNWSIFPIDYSLRDWRVYNTFLDKRWPQSCEMCAGDTPISHRCKHCEIYICNDCKLIHKRVRKLKHHELLPLRDAETEKLCSKYLEFFSEDVICSEHQDENEVIRFFCCSCRKSICSVCAVIQHQGHMLSLLPKVYDEEKTKSESLHSCIQNLISEIEDSMNSVAKEIEEIHSQAIAQKKVVTETIANAEFILYRTKRKLEGEIDDLCNQKLKLLQGQIESVFFFKDLCKQACAFLDHSLLYKKKPAFLEISQAILHRLIELNNMSFDTQTNTTARSLRYIKTEGVNSLREACNSLVSFRNTNAIIPCCRFSGSSWCLVNDESEITFFVKHFKLSVTSDEKIECKVSHGGTDNELIYQSTDEPGKALVKWTPSEPGLYKLTLYNNEIKIAEKDIHVEKKEMVLGGAMEKKTDFLYQHECSPSRSAAQRLGKKKEEVKLPSSEIGRRKIRTSTLHPSCRSVGVPRRYRYKCSEVRSGHLMNISRKDVKEMENSSFEEQKDVVGGANKEEPSPRLENTPPKDPPTIPKPMGIQKPDMTFDKTTAHRAVSISSDGKVFKNTSSGEQVELVPNKSRLRTYKGAICSTGFQYPGRFKYAIKIGIEVKKPLDKSNLVFELGIARRSVIGENLVVEGQKYAWSMIGAHHVDCDAICIHIAHNYQLLYHDVLTSNLRGSSREITFDFLLDTEFGQWKVFDKKFEKQICVVEAVDCSELLYPVVAGYNPSSVEVTATIVHVD